MDNGASPDHAASALSHPIMGMACAICIASISGKRFATLARMQSGIGSGVPHAPDAAGNAIISIRCFTLSIFAFTLFALSQV